MTRHTVKTDKPGDLRGLYCVQDDLSPRFLHCAALNLGVPLAGLALLQLATAQEHLKLKSILESR